MVRLVMIYCSQQRQRTDLASFAEQAQDVVSLRGRSEVSSATGLVTMNIRSNNIEKGEMKYLRIYG